MEKNKVAIIGYGFVGRGMHKIFPDAICYDPMVNFSKEPKGTFTGGQKQINEQCGLAIVCVPTPPIGMEGQQKVNEDEDNYLGVDLSIIEETIKWLVVPNILIKSTIPPGTTKILREKYGKAICFSPEYMGEGNYYVPPKYPDPLDPTKHDFMVIGGHKESCEQVLAFFMRKLGPAKRYLIMSAEEAECVKYMENTWGAMKVSFCQEWFEMCQKFGASYEVVREGFLADARTEPMHTAVFRDKRGFGGKCYPKDLMGIIAHSEKNGYEPKLLKQIWETNKEMVKKSE